MSKQLWGWTAAAALFCTAIWILRGSTPAQERVTPIPVQTDPVRADQKNVGPLMLAKLGHAQRVLEGLVTHDFDRIASAAGSLKLMSLDPPEGWDRNSSDDEVYEHFRMEFMRQAARLEKMAQQKNLSGAAWFQQNLTATCISCHEYIRDENLN